MRGERSRGQLARRTLAVYRLESERWGELGVYGDEREARVEPSRRSRWTSQAGGSDAPGQTWRGCPRDEHRGFMHPHTFYSSFFDAEKRNEVFVIISLTEPFGPRWRDVIEPCIREDLQLAPVRVDYRKSGDSVIHDILDGIARARLVIAAGGKFSAVIPGWVVNRTTVRQVQNLEETS